MRVAISHKRADQAGMTLVEVMVAMVLTAILLVGMNALWVNITREVDALVLRQKAIFRLNGEMERLVGLYATDSTAVDSVTSPNPDAPIIVTDYQANAPANVGDYIANAPNVTNAVAAGWSSDPANGNRFIYRANAAGFVINDASGAEGGFGQPLGADRDLMNTATVTSASADSIYSHVLQWHPGLTAGEGGDRNLVWLDRDKNIVAQISWSTVLTTSACRGTLGCRHVTMYIDYPFRYVDQNNPRNEIDSFPISTITLQTIVSSRN